MLGQKTQVFLSFRHISPNQILTCYIKITSNVGNGTKVERPKPLKDSKEFSLKITGNIYLHQFLATLTTNIFIFVNFINENF